MIVLCDCVFFFFQAEDGIRDLVRSRGLGDVYKRQWFNLCGFGLCQIAIAEDKIEEQAEGSTVVAPAVDSSSPRGPYANAGLDLSLIHI